jgi:CheY-like chemotaxis protein
MTKDILWLDNDIPYIRPYVNKLRANGYQVHQVGSLSDAEELLDQSKTPFGLIIVDVMVPTRDEAELANYPVKATDYGHKSGLVFYNRMKKKYGSKLPPVAVTTVRIDQDIRDEFIESGLEQEHFLTKFDVRDPADFLKRITAIIEAAKPDHVAG